MGRAPSGPVGVGSLWVQPGQGESSMHARGQGVGRKLGGEALGLSWCVNLGKLLNLLESVSWPTK